MLIKAASAGDVAQVRAALAAGADMNAKTSNGGTALMTASFGGHLEVVQALLAAGADVNAKVSWGDTALIMASVKGQLAVVQALIAAKADVNAKARSGFTALIASSLEGNPKVVQALLAAGADVNAKMGNGDTALIMASQKGHQEIVQLLKEAGGGNSGAPSISSAFSASRGNAKFVCSSGIESGNPGAIQFVYELKSDGRVYASTNLSPIGTAGTYSIDGNRIIIVINGNSVVYGFTNGVLSMGAGIDCKKVE
jgi:ankyrin repeat protein